MFLYSSKKSFIDAYIELNTGQTQMSCGFWKKGFRPFEHNELIEDFTRLLTEAGHTLIHQTICDDDIFKIMTSEEWQAFRDKHAALAREKCMEFIKKTFLTDLDTIQRFFLSAENSEFGQELLAKFNIDYSDEKAIAKQVAEKVLAHYDSEGECSDGGYG